MCSTSHNNARSLIITIAILTLFIVGSQQSSWVNLGAQVYYVNNEKLVNWYGANNECTRRGMKLLALETKEKSDRLREHLEMTDQLKFWYWTSGNDLEHKNEKNTTRTLMWFTTGRPFSYTNWRPGEPNSLNNDEQCIMLENDFTWNDQNCYIHFFFICESTRASGYLIPANWNSTLSSSADRIYIGI